uniref:AI-2E family transporter n=1 Tax=Globisporangium ultimum (strain ATCC 200006 / CBS 805.95 / DAOM BR144) TaxID=431595 RepID=K3WEC1_GLOUD
MKLGSKDVAYSSLELDDPSSPLPLRRNTSSSSSQSTMSSSAASMMDSMASSSQSYFANTSSGPHGGGNGSPRRGSGSHDHSRFGTTSDGNDSNDYHRSAFHETLAALEGPVRQLTVEVKGALLATGVAATCYLLAWFQAVLVPFFLAIFLMYLVDPLVEMIDVSPRYFLCICTSRGRHRRRKSRGCSRAFASLCAVSVVCIFFGLLGYITVLSVHALDATAYQSGYNNLIEGVEKVLTQIGLPTNITTTLHDNIDKLVRIVITETMDLFSVMFVTVIYLTYFLCTRTRASDAGGVWSKIDHDIQRFVTLKCFLSLFVALLVTVVYVSLNVGLAIVWGILTFILNWIPNVGAMIASILPICIIAITPSHLMNPMEKILAMGLPMAFHMFVGNFIEPKVFGKKLEMDPVIVILSLSAWGLLWGVVGMMLSVPLTAAAKIMLSHLKLWPELVAIMEGTYFAKYGLKSSYKKDEKDEFESMEVRTDVQTEKERNGISSIMRP